MQSLVDEGRITRERGRLPPAAVADPAGARGGRRARARPLGARHQARRPLPALQRRPVRRGVRRDAARRPSQLPEPQDAVDRLVELALRGGGPDNITCIVADVLDEAGGGRGDVVVGGAAAEHTVETLPRPDTPAARASLMTKPSAQGAARPSVRTASRTPPAAGGTPCASSRSWSSWLAVLAGGLFGVRTYLDRQYYVGVSSNEVAIFRGVPESVARLSSCPRSWQRTGIAVSGLLPFWRDKVQGNITAGSLGGAQQIVSELRANQLPACAAAGTPTGAPTSTPVTAPTPATTTAAGAPATTPPTAGAPAPTRELRRRSAVTAVAAGAPTGLPPVRTGRRPEALMLALGLLVDLAAYVAVGVGHDKSFPSSIGVVRRRFRGPLPRGAPRRTQLAPYADPLLLPSSRSSTASAGRSSTGSTSPTPTARASSPGRCRTATPTCSSSGCCSAWRSSSPCSPWSATTAPCSATPTPRWPPASCCCCSLPSCRRVQRGQRRQDLGPAGRPVVPAERGRQAAAGRLLRRLPRGQARRAVAGQQALLRPRPAARPRPRPGARRLAADARRR